LIAHLKGRILQKAPAQVTIDVCGVGYGAAIPLSTYFQLGEVNSACELYIYTHLTDSSLALFGFSTAAEKEVFLKLIAVSGIGPRLALSVLSGIGPEELETAVRSSDVARITKIPGIGKKLAMRIALELQEKMGKKDAVLPAESSKQREDLISALLNLGFRRKEVEGIVDQTIKELTPEAGEEKLLRESLRKLARM
jgi:Holliday junction DNA helicase RuvA